jgi:hypothetical protein
MQKALRQLAILSLCGAVTILTGCGGGGEDADIDSNNSPPQTGSNSGGSELAPASIGGKTVTGHIGGTNTIFEVVTSGGTTGSYTYSENGEHLNDGTYSWTKTSANSGVLTLAPDNHMIELDYTGTKHGNYVFHTDNYTETGTFSTN